MTKEISKRQARREQIRRKDMRNRLLGIGLISIVAILVAFLIIYPNFKPVGDISTAPEMTRSQVKFNAAGNPDAPIRIDEYSDFQCPYCRIFFEETESQIMESYVADGTVYFVYNSFGDFIGPESAAAAEAAYCAGDQEKFWEMHDIIFANQTGENVGNYTDRRLSAFAEKIGLDMDQFNSCYNGGDHRDRVNQDAKNATIAGIKATPSFVLTYTVNGEPKTRLIEGAQGYDAFKLEIDAALAEIGQ
ncbi:MAG: thioredoxin domain-containing protein [Anaerolineales bacterium]|nr:thioredoxin domain-containing protein [Anaerolineales bacterium]MBP6209404.1 thioredoxin domain-containing protein [Anaerolineales bacterium]MBP8165283.1 thioredoxin domain-containing protein [Anaerolineales bacterium]